tara:strand:- start:77610 stop:77723 length:114 start_codon:yes stop_codon:yes gene_type:complete
MFIFERSLREGTALRDASGKIKEIYPSPQDFLLFRSR